MINESKSYSLFFRFIETYASFGFHGIDPGHPLLLELEELMERNNQFFFVGDILQMKIKYTSKRSIQMIGLPPDEVTPYHFREGVHPDDALRFGLANTQLFKMVNEIFIEKKGTGLLSADLRIRNSQGYYSDLLFQCYLFYCEIPVKTVYLLQIHTDIDWFIKIKKKNHYYVGNDLSNLKYPDEELLKMGNPLTDREFEIVKLIESGLSSEQIAEKIFLSIHTISTHRSNIVNKTGYNTIAELIIDFQKRGML
jgi:DNA-binding CsgD family transcriptional regulator